MAIAVYPKTKKTIFDEYLAGSGVAKTFKLLILKSTATYDATDEFITDVVSGSVEIDAIGYARVTVSTITVTVSGANIILDGDDETFAAINSGQTMGAVVIFYERTVGGADGTSRPLVWFDGGSSPNELPKATNGGEFTVVWPSGGILTA